MSRRQALIATAAIATLVASSQSAQAAVDDDDCGLEKLSLGGQWTKLENAAAPMTDSVVPATFATFAVRFLINYDQGANLWWNNDILVSNSFLPETERQAKLGKSFGCLARSVQMSFDRFLQEQQDSSTGISQGYEQLANVFIDKYGVDTEAMRHIGLLFATLPPDLQPSLFLKQVSTKTISKSDNDDEELEVDFDALNVRNPPPQSLMELSALLPPEFEVVRIKGTNAHTIYPPISLYEVGIDEEFGQTATATATGPLASSPLTRERPKFGWDIYALFGISGGTGCALTHSVVIPLDVVKTRIQTDGSSESLLESAANILENEGPEGLLLGAQATVAGYLWYGVSVYPTYAFFKRFLAHSVLSPQMATVHMNDVALIAGAIAAVVASLGLTPLEAARIRTVAEPDVYRSQGLLGTLNTIAEEDPVVGWKTLYAGLPSLMTRQVIFGSVKFLAFERACEAIFKVWPVLHDATWTSLGVSLAAGGFSGALSSVVSQPADSVLTYVAQQGSGMGVLEGCRVMMETEGVASLFRGLGSRCVWASCIIAGQFLLYDVFRTYFHVSGNDLSQVYEVAIQSING